MGPDLLYQLAQLVEVVRRGEIDVGANRFSAALEEAETLLALLAESGVTVGEVS